MKKEITCPICENTVSKGFYKDGVVDYFCENCNITFLNNKEKTIIS